MARLSFRCDEELVAAVDRARGGVARERWLRVAVEQALGGQVTGPPRSVESASQLPPAEQPEHGGVMEFDDEGHISRFEGTYAPRVRSSSEARPFRPAPKKGGE